MERRGKGEEEGREKREEEGRGQERCRDSEERGKIKHE